MEVKVAGSTLVEKAERGVAALRREGPVQAVLGRVQRVIAPVVACHPYHVYDTPVPALPRPFGVPATVGLRVHQGPADLEAVWDLLGRGGETPRDRVARRLERGDLAVVAHAGPELAGYTWVALADAWVPELQLVMMLRSGEAMHHDAFVPPAWQGQRLHSILVAAATEAARARGCTRELAYISPLNRRAMRLPVRLGWRRALTMVCVQPRHGRPRWLTLGGDPWQRFREPHLRRARTELAAGVA
ncbi:MAG TPA: GNAT family N-acetyltransferase [Polyangia bacterium]